MRFILWSLLIKISKIIKKTFRANGKLLLSGEYFVLDGALALALPTRLGQTLEIESDSFVNPVINWGSLNEKSELWFFDVFSLPSIDSENSSDFDISEKLEKILRTAKELNPSFCDKNYEYVAQTKLEFPREWGLGSSSTLIYLIAQWANVNPFKLLKASFGGSGYDLACAGSPAPILYQRKKKKPNWEYAKFNPSFKENLYFIYLGKKQNSREGIARYRQKVKNEPDLVAEISDLTKAFLSVKKLDDFQKIIVEHENLVAKTLELPRAKDLYFKSFEGEVKSLGAWGGDFVLAAVDWEEEEMQVFCKKNKFKTFFKYEDLILDLSA